MGFLRFRSPVYRRFAYVGSIKGSSIDQFFDGKALERQLDRLFQENQVSGFLRAITLKESSHGRSIDIDRKVNWEGRGRLLENVFRASQVACLETVCYRSGEKDYPDLYLNIAQGMRAPEWVFAHLCLRESEQSNYAEIIDYLDGVNSKLAAEATSKWSEKRFGGDIEDWVIGLGRYSNGDQPQIGHLKGEWLLRQNKQRKTGARSDDPDDLVSA